MQIDIITVVPELLKSPFEHSIMKRAGDKGLLQINIVNLRSFGLGLHHQVDDYQYGGGAGMVMMCEPLDRCIMDLKSKTKYDEIIYLTPDGKTFNQKMANRLSCLDAVLIICGHYKGIDQRIRDMHVTMEISVGDFVDAIGRLIPGVLNDETSALSDSFQDNLLAPPVYTRPADFKGFKIPDILLSGNERMIDEWRYEESLKITKERRPDLLED